MAYISAVIAYIALALIGNAAEVSCCRSVR